VPRPRPGAPGLGRGASGDVYADPLRGANIGCADPLRGANIGCADVPRHSDGERKRQRSQSPLRILDQLDDLGLDRNGEGGGDAAARRGAIGDGKQVAGEFEGQPVT